MKCSVCGSTQTTSKIWQERDGYEGTMVCERCGHTVTATGDSLQEVLEILERARTA